jgi:hypothetical protein
MSAAGENEAAAESPGTDAAISQNFDPSSLPPIDSIVAGTDIRAFLRFGVPPALTRAALRRAWVSEPAIRDFIGIAENQWDFTDPTATPGFGPLLETDDMSGLVAQALGMLDKSPEALADTNVSVEEEALSSTSDPAYGAVDPAVHRAGNALTIRQVNAEILGSAHESIEVGMAAKEGLAATESRLQRRRPHGSALPQ